MPALVEIGLFKPTKFEWGEGQIIVPGETLLIPHHSKLKGEVTYAVHTYEAYSQLLISQAVNRLKPSILDTEVLKRIPLTCLANFDEMGIVDDKSHENGVTQLQHGKPAYIFHARTTPDSQLLTLRVSHFTL